MQDISVRYNQPFVGSQASGAEYAKSTFAGILEIPSPSHSMLREEGGENFYEYLDWLGLTHHDDIIVLPLSQHFYYDHEDMKNVRILINLRRLNRISNLDGFLYNLSSMLPSGSSFIGCFSDCKSRKYSGMPASLYRGFMNLIDARKDEELDSEEVTGRLEKSGFRVADMTEFGEITYFRAVSL